MQKKQKDNYGSTMKSEGDVIDKLTAAACVKRKQKYTPERKLDALDSRYCVKRKEKCTSVHV